MLNLIANKLLNLPRYIAYKSQNYTKLVNPFIKNKYLSWSIHIINNRLRYKFEALYCGILINRSTKANLYNFRRNIHRIEKGLSFPQRKDVFAEDYILETVNFLEANKSTGVFDSNTKAWGESVLDLYFQTCQHSDKIEEAYKLYKAVRSQSNFATWIPYRGDSRPKLSVEYESLYQLALRRRSVRFYLPKIIEADLIKKAMKIAALSPSACNRQSFKFLFFNDNNLVRKISQIPGGVSGYDIPSVIVVVGSYRGYFDERDINAPIIDSSLAVMSFLFALETLGLSSVCINWPNLLEREEKIRQLIHLEKDEFIVMLIGVGYPSADGKIPYSAKKDLEELVLINQRIK